MATWAEETSRACLADALPRRWAHVSSAAKEARRISAVVGTDGDLLVTAALLHDVGYAPTVRDSGFHPLDGARYLASLGVSARLCALVARHSCAIREARMRGLGDEVAAFADEASVVRDALWYCDMVTGPDGSRVRAEDRIAEITDRYGPDDLVSRFIEEANGELLAAVARTTTRLDRAGIDHAT